MVPSLELRNKETFRASSAHAAHQLSYRSHDAGDAVRACGAYSAHGARFAAGSRAVRDVVAFTGIRSACCCLLFLSL